MPPHVDLGGDAATYLPEEESWVSLFQPHLTVLGSAHVGLKEELELKRMVEYFGPCRLR